MNIRYKRFKELGLCVRCGSARENGKTRCASCHQKHLVYTLKAKNKALSNGKCRTCLSKEKINGYSTCESCLSENKIREKERYAKIRLLCIEGYGGKCVCCGISDPRYLQLDHVDNDGVNHRRELFGGRQGSIYPWAAKNKFPRLLQLLCANCHQAKTIGQPCCPTDHVRLYGLNPTTLSSGI